MHAASGSLVYDNPPQKMGTLFTLGYAQPTASAHLAEWMGDPTTCILDIRYRPTSRWNPVWRQLALVAAYEERYHWDQRLGNINYRQRERGIQLAEGHELALHEAATRLQAGTSLVLLCACKEAKHCHRSLVADLLQDAVCPVFGLAVIHL